MIDDGLLQELKLSLRVSSAEFEPEIEMLADAALEDMERAGVDPDYLAALGPRVRHAVACYCKAHFGYDNAEACRFDQSYRQIVIDMLNSSRNVADTSEDDG